jgi:hypothetical protein
VQLLCKEYKEYKEFKEFKKRNGTRIQELGGVLHYGRLLELLELLVLLSPWHAVCYQTNRGFQLDRGIAQALPRS